MNSKEVIKLMVKAGWTPAQFMESLNSAARMERHSSKFNRGYNNRGTPPAANEVPQITLAMAQQFLTNGTGIDGAAYDVLERWVARRSGVSNVVGNCFDPPVTTQRLANVSSPVILPADTELSEDVIQFQNVTNERARQKMLGR